MEYVILSLKIITSIYLIISIVEMVISNHERKHYVLFSLIMMMLILDVRALITKDMVFNIFEQLLLFAFLLYVGNQVIKGKNAYSSFMTNILDYQALMTSSIMKNISEAVAIINADNLTVNSYNERFDLMIKPLMEYYNIQEIISKIKRDESEIVFNNLKEQKSIIQFRMRELNKRYIVLYAKDVTSEKRHVQLLKNKEAYEKQIWDELGVGVILGNMEGKIVYFNPFAAAFFELSPSELNRKSIFSIFESVEEENWIDKVIETLVTTGEGFDTENRIHIKKLETKYFSFFGKIIDYDLEKHYFFIIRDESESVIENFKSKAYESLIQKYYKTLYEPIAYINLIDKHTTFTEYLTEKLPDTFLLESNILELLLPESRLLMNEAILDPKLLQSQLLEFVDGVSFRVENYLTDNSSNLVAIIMRYIESYDSSNYLNNIGKMLIEHMSEGILIVDQTGIIQYCNEMITRLLGYAPNGLLGQSMGKVSKVFTEEAFQKNWQMTKLSKSLHYEKTYITALNTELNVEVTTLIVDDINTESLVLLIREAGERSKSISKPVITKKRFEQLIDAMSDGLIEIKIQDRSVTLYDTEHGDYESTATTLSYYDWFEKVHEEDKAYVGDSIDAIMSDKLKKEKFDFRYKESEEWIWYAAIASYIVSNKGDYIVISLQNIDDIKRISGDLEEYKKILNESEKVSEMAHWKFDVANNQFIVSTNFKNVMKLRNSGKDIFDFEQVQEMVHPSDSNYFKNKFERAIFEKSNLDIIVRIIRKGKVRYVSFVGSVHLNEGDLTKMLIGNIMDITSKHEVNIRLKDSRKLLKSIIDQSPTGIIVIKKSGMIELINEEALQLLNIEQLPEDSRYQLQQIMSSAYRDEEGHPITDKLSDLFSAKHTVMKIKRIQDHNQWLHVYSSPMRNEENMLTGNIIILVDVTEMLAIQERLEVQTKRLVSAEKLVKLGHFEFYDEFEQLYTSEMIYSIFERKDYINFNTNTLLSMVGDYDRSTIMEQIYLIRQFDGEYLLEFDLVTQNGLTKHLQIKIIKETKKGYAHYQGTVQDVSLFNDAIKKIKQSENEKAIILESVHEHIAFYDNQLRIITMNHLDKTRLINPNIDVTGKKCIDIFKEEMRNCNDCFVSKTIELKIPLVREYEKENKWYEQKTYPVFDDFNDIAGVVEVTRDITKEHFLRERQKTLDKMKLYGQASKGIALDLNNKIMGLHGYLDMINNFAELPFSVKEHIRVMQKTVDALQETSERLAVLGDQGDYHLKAVEVESVVKSAIKMLEYTYEAHIDLSCDKEESLFILGSEDILFNIMMSILINAIEATEYESMPMVKVKIKARMDDKNEHRVVIDIEDNGPGIKVSPINKVFESFYTTKDKSNHAGMGLTTTRSLVNELKGNLSINNKLKGLIFTVDFKRIYELESSHLDTIGPTTQIESTILVVDDEEIIRLLIEQILLAKGYNVITTSHLDEAISVVEEYGDQLGLVYLDMIMPENSGKVVFENLKRIKPDLRILVMTGYSEDADIEYVLRQGALGVMKKPVSNQEILTAALKHAPLEMNSKVDKDKALSILGNNVDLYDKIATKFYRKYKDYPKRLQNALLEGDKEEIRISAHAIKGVVGNIGDDILEGLSFELEKRIREDRPYEQQALEVISRLEELIKYLEVQYFIEETDYIDGT